MKLDAGAQDALYGLATGMGVSQVCLGGSGGTLCGLLVHPVVIALQLHRIGRRLFADRIGRTQTACKAPRMNHLKDVIHRGVRHVLGRHRCARMGNPWISEEMSATHIGIAARGWVTLPET